MRIGALCLSALLMAAAAFAAAPERTAQLRAASEKVLADTPEAAAIWESLGDGALRHKPSGLVCPGDNTPRMPLVKLVVTASPPPEHNGICLYQSEDGTEITRLAATNVGETAPVEKILSGLHDFVLEQYAGAKSLGPVSSMLLPAAKGEAFAVTINGRSAMVLLYVTVVKDWSVWTVVSFPHDTPSTEAAYLYSMVQSGAFHVGVAGVTRLSQGLPEPRLNP